MKTKKKEDHRSENQAKAQLESIREMVSKLDNEETREDAEQEIHEDPLSVRVREGWHSPGEKGEVEEFEILLCTGGPACRIVGTLNQYNEPEHARIEHQDWFTPWTEYRINSEDEAALLEYCRTFYFGE